ncbi:putative acetyltransferase [Thalassoglobus neptunius]|uniref:Putative acetyltransferase n=1 Tax=Thalassoglobus neptunius TaxID=1938619 RepID=A0A5C5UUL4_9PLAN
MSNRYSPTTGWQRTPNTAGTSPKEENKNAKPKPTPRSSPCAYGNEIGGLFVQPSHHGTGIGRALVDKPQSQNGTLEVEVFSKNSIGRRFYTRYGFVKMEEKLHEPTGQKVLRLKCTTDS